MAPAATTLANGGSNAQNGLQASAPAVDPTAARRNTVIHVASPDVEYTDEHILSSYKYHGAEVVQDGETYKVKPTVKGFQFKTERTVPKTGLMMVGLGGNNGTTIAATILANRHNITWHTKEGMCTPNYIGSLVRASTIKLGIDASTGKDVYVPLSDVMPMVHPNDLVVGGWDISGLEMDAALGRAQVMDYDLQRQVAPLLKGMKPLPSIYYPDFIAANQGPRADNVIPGMDKKAHVEHLRKDIREFKAANGLDKVVVFWTANTERYSEVIPGVNDTADNLLRALEQSHNEISPSTVFAIACILEGDTPFINGAPQNTFVPGVIELAERHRAFIGGDDLKTGQTKVKSVLAEFLVNAGIKIESISSYNHLGNNDGMNLDSYKQFRSKEISKSSVVDDMTAANHLLYNKDEHPDHIVVIKHVPAVGDGKRAIDEYYSSIAMGGHNTLNIFNHCEDSLLAAPLILDLTILAEVLTRVSYRRADPAPGVPKAEEREYEPLYPILSLLSYLLKAPLVKPGQEVVNSLNRQRAGLTNFFRACIGLQPESDLLLEGRVW